jgi:hypothetical protein
MCVYKQLVHTDTLLHDGHGLLFLYVPHITGFPFKSTHSQLSSRCSEGIKDVMRHGDSSDEIK